MRQTIAHVSMDHILAESRENVLRSAGYEVRTFHSSTEFTSSCAGHHFDLLLVGHSLPLRDREQVRQVFRQYSPDAPIIQLQSKNEEVASDGWRTFDIFDGPEKLLQFLAQVFKPEAVGG